jgi:hypothetical protein
MSAVKGGLLTVRNVPGYTSDPELTLSQILDLAFGVTEGLVIYRDAVAWQALQPGTFGYVLTTQGPGFPVVWGPGTGTLSPAFTSFGITGQSTPVEVGATIGNGPETFTWSTSNSGSVQANSISIVDTTASNTLASGLANTGSDTITIPGILNILPASQVWTINGVSTASANFSATFAVLWEWRVYSGGSTNVTLTANQIKALSASSNLQASYGGTYPITNGSNGYYYLSYPDSMGSVVNFTDASTGFPISMATASDNAAYSNTANGWSYALVSVTNANSITTNYRVYRTQYEFSGTLNMEVS